VLTSWTVHLFPWELQGTSIDLARFIAAHPDGSLEAFEKAYVREHFGTDDRGFFRAAGKLARRGLFNYAADLGFFKDARPAPAAYVEDRIEEIAKRGELEKELAVCETRLREYTEGLTLFGAYAKKAKSGRDELLAWDLAARNLVDRAEAARILLKARLEGAGPDVKTEAARVLERMRALSRETEAAVAARIKPSRTREIIDWMYSSMGNALEKLAGSASGR
jgi:hypothetical protein